MIMYNSNVYNANLQICSSKYRMSYKKNTEIPFILVGKLIQLIQKQLYNFPLDEMDRQSTVSSSDCDADEYEDFNLLTVVNEHSEVIGLIEDDRDANSPISNHNEIEIFHHPPDIPESNSDGNNSVLDEKVEENDSESEQNEEHYIVHQDENNHIQNNIPLSQIPVINYDHDVEHKDFRNGWEWTKRDPGSSCGPFIAHPRLLIQPASLTPKGFFNLLFDQSMWTLLA